MSQMDRFQPIQRVLSAGLFRFALDFPGSRKSEEKLSSRARQPCRLREIAIPSIEHLRLTVRNP
jgi:hypothetical protein